MKNEMLKLTEVQEFVAETRERRALMATKKARRYQRGSICRSENGEIWYGKYYPAPGAPQKRVRLGRTAEMDEKQARIALDEIVSALNRDPAHSLGAEPVRRFVQQVYIPMKYENGDWREKTGREVESLLRRSVLSEIGEIRCRDLRSEHLRGILRGLAKRGLSYESVDKVRCAIRDMVSVMVAEEYLRFNIASGLKTPRAARRSDRSKLRRVTLREYLEAWTRLEERERLAFDLVTFCGLRGSEVYGLKKSDLLEGGAIRIVRSWYKGSINAPKTGVARKIGVPQEIFERLMAWIGGLQDQAEDGWIFASEQIGTPLLPDNVLRRCIYPLLKPGGLDWINFAVLRRSHSTLHHERGTDPKVIADQQGHGLGVHLSNYVQTSTTTKREAASVLWVDFVTLRSEQSLTN